MTNLSSILGSPVEIASDLCPQFALAANTIETYTLPGDYTTQYQVQFSFPASSNVWVGFNNLTPTVPTAGTMTQNARCTRNPEKWWCRGGDTLSFISSTIVTDCGLAIYTVNKSGS